MGVKWVKGGGCGWKLPMNWEFDAMDKTAKLVLLVAVALAASTAATAAQVNSYVTFRVLEPENPGHSPAGSWGSESRDDGQSQERLSDCDQQL